MGMNIYADKEMEKHIGKRSANGVWCWDCNVRADNEHIYFCKKDKKELIINGVSYMRKCPKCKKEIAEVELVDNPYKVPDWMETRTLFKCPSCGKSKFSNEIGYNATFRELGFDKSKPVRHSGIDGASMFSWAVKSEDSVGNNKKEVLKAIKKLDKIYTEYGDEWTPDDFEEMLFDVIEEHEVDSCWFS